MGPPRVVVGGWASVAGASVPGMGVGSNVVAVVGSITDVEGEGIGASVGNRCVGPGVVVVVTGS